MVSNASGASFVVLAAFLACGCYPEGQEVTAQRPIGQVLEEVSRQWISIPGVVAVAQGSHEGRPCILVLCTVERMQLKDRIPSVIEGYQVIIQRTNQIKALD